MNGSKLNLVMNKSFFVFIALFLAFSATVYGQGSPAGFDLSNYGVRIEPDKRVMVVLATIEAARTVDAEGNPVKVIKRLFRPQERNSATN